MKPVFQFVVCCGMLLTTLLGAAQVKTTGFLIDPTKDYVYLQFDHIGKREPIAGDEVNTGLWIRLVNNCRVPVVVATFDPGTGDPGMGVYDEVVPAVASGPIFRLKKEDNSPSQPSTRSTAKAPIGYTVSDVFSTTRIPPGESILFSVPANHVGLSWSIKVRFYLAPTKEAYGSGPYSVLSFDWVDIPEQYRAAWEHNGVSNVTQEPKGTSPTLLHESGHIDPPKPQ